MEVGDGKEDRQRRGLRGEETASVSETLASRSRSMTAGEMKLFLSLFFFSMFLFIFFLAKIVGDAQGTSDKMGRLQGDKRR